MALYRPGRVVLTVVATFGLAIGGSIAFATVTGEPSTRAIDPAGRPSTPDASPSDGPPPTPAVDATPKQTPSKPRTSESAEPFAPTPTDVPGTTATESDPTSPGTPSPRTPTPDDRYERAGDTTLPETRLSVEQPAPDAARLRFSASEQASFTCSLDGAPFAPCTSPSLFSDLEPGWHTFAVEAADAAGNTDPSPAETRWLAKGSHATPR